MFVIHIHLLTTGFDGGESWKEINSLDLLPGWAGTSDPALAWDD
jgi:hypothetical protein